MQVKTLKPLDQIKIGQRIREKREFLKMTREDLASKLGISVRFLSDIEYGNKGFSVQNLYNLSQVLEISTDFILNGGIEDNMESNERGEIKAKIMEPLKACSVGQLRFMEQIAINYVAGLKEK